MNIEFRENLKEILTQNNEELIELWLEYFDDEEKNEEYRYYDDFLGFFEECVDVDLDIHSEETKALQHFLEKLKNILGEDKFFNFKSSVYTCFLKFPILKKMDELNLINYDNLSVITKFFEALTSHIMIELIEQNNQIQSKSIKELSEREAPIAEIWEGIFMISIVGSLDSDRILKIIDKVLDKIEENNIQHVIIDISAIFDMNSEIANQIIKLNKSIHFMGVTPILTGITKNIAKSLTHLDISLGEIKTYSKTKLALKEILNANM